ncbi:MAG: DsbA family protein [Alphaproteobacteria bacterium]|nr:DsbA family protein [Alphaproteobacteria bacterium]
MRGDGPGPLFLIGVAAAFVGVLWATSQTEVPEPAAPAPVVSVPAPPASAPVVIEQGTSRPDGRAPLQPSNIRDIDALGVEGLAELEEQPLLVALAVMNGTTAACEPCWVAGESLATCLVQRREVCPEAEAQARRVVRGAAAGVDPRALQASIQFNDAWLDVPPMALVRRGPDAPTVRLVVAVDFASPFSADARVVWTTLAQRYPDGLAVEWLHAPREAPGAQAAARAALAADLQGRYDAMAQALFALPPDTFAADVVPEAALKAAAEEAGLDVAAWTAAMDSAAVRARLDAERAAASTLGVRGTPTAFVNGYRVRGLRDIDAYARIIDLELADAEARP